ncbi:MAG: DUF1330 domain-containing protein [Solirubrobacterales bacterium]|nr:DUF1330 domain-containing protein [Solirubrobacterales bacterium]
MSEPTIEPDANQIGKLTNSTDESPILMLNLVKFKAEADGADAGMSGAEAYGTYSMAVAPFLESVGGEVLSAATCEDSIIGPEEKEWDMVIQVKYPNRQAFIRMVTDPEYLKISAHRTAGLADSRLIVSNLVFPTG